MDMNKDMLTALGLDLGELKYQIVETVAEKIADEIGRDIKRKLQEKAQAQVEKHITEIVKDVSTQVFQPVNTWGEPDGEPTTIRNMMEKSIERWWIKKVDSKGEDSTSYSAIPRAEYYAKEIVGKYVDYELKKEMNKIIEAGRNTVRKAMAKSIEEQLRNLW